MAVNLTGLFGDVSNLASSVSLQDIIQQAAIGTAVTVAVAGAKSQEGQDAIDFMHLFHKPATATAPAVSGVVSGGQVMTMTQFNALPPDQQNMVKSGLLHYTIIPG